MSGKEWNGMGKEYVGKEHGHSQKDKENYKA